MDWGECRLPKAWCDIECNLCHEHGHEAYGLKDLGNQNSDMDAKSTQTNADVTKQDQGMKSKEDKLCLKSFKIKCKSNKSEDCDGFDLFKVLGVECKRDDKNHSRLHEDPYLGIRRRNSLERDEKSNDHHEITGCSYQETNENIRDSFHIQQRAIEVKHAVREALHQEFGKEAYAKVEEELSKEVYSIQDLQFLCDLLGISEKFNEICRRNIPFHELSGLIFETWATHTFQLYV